MKRIFVYTIFLLMIFSVVNVKAFEGVSNVETKKSIIMLIDNGSSLEGNLETGMTKIIKIIRTFYDMIMVLVPIVLLVMGAFDLFKAVASQDEKAIKAAVSTVGRRIMWAGIALSAMLIFRLVLSFFVGGREWLSYWK